MIYDMKSATRANNSPYLHQEKNSIPKLIPSMTDASGKQKAKIIILKKVTVTAV